jgi:predicted component of type VI protein secretion system
VKNLGSSLRRLDPHRHAADGPHLNDLGIRREDFDMTPARAEAERLAREGRATVGGAIELNEATF